MSSISITHTVYRNDDEPIELAVTGDIYRGTIEDFTIEPNIPLTADETASIEERLDEALADDWDEDSYKASKERD